MTPQPEKLWYQTLYTYIWVFNTGRGLSILVRLPTNIGILYDLGSSEGFSPTEFITKHIASHLTKYKPNEGDENATALAQCILSHPHADHIWEMDAILESKGKKPPLYPSLLTCPNDKDGQDDNQKVDFTRIRTEENGELIDKYRSAYARRNLPLQTIRSTEASIPHVEYGIYYLQPGAVGAEHPSVDQDYANGLSIIFYLRHGNQSILIPGDVTPEVLSRILADHEVVEKRYTYFWDVPDEIASDFHASTSYQPGLGAFLGERGLSILIAPHHGLESGFSEELFECTKGGQTQLNVISDERHAGGVAGQVDARYQSSGTSSSIVVDAEGKPERRFSVSTLNGQHILIIFKGTDASPHVYLRKDPLDLLKIA